MDGGSKNDATPLTSSEKTPIQVVDTPKVVHDLSAKLFSALQKLRSQLLQEAEEGLYAYHIFGNETLQNISKRIPLNKEQLLEVKGVSKAKVNKYGDRVLETIKATISEHYVGTRPVNSNINIDSNAFEKSHSSTVGNDSSHSVKRRRRTINNAYDDSIDEDACAARSKQMVEKFSSPQSDIICVRGYKVKQSNAPLLGAIFKKHGDIADKCILKSDYVRSSILEAVCEVVRQIQTSEVIENMKELQCRVSDAEANNINVAWLRAHLEAIDERKDSSKKYTLLMGMKQNMILAKIGAQKDLRERCDELAVAQQRFTTAERCVRVLNLVEKNLNGQIFESKAKKDSLVNHPVV